MGDRLSLLWQTPLQDVVPTQITNTPLAQYVDRILAEGYKNYVDISIRTWKCHGLSLCEKHPTICLVVPTQSTNTPLAQYVDRILAEGYKNYVDISIRTWKCHGLSLCEKHPTICLVVPTQSTNTPLAQYVDRIIDYKNFKMPQVWVVANI